MLNWTTESIITLIAGLPIFLGCLILYGKYRQHQNRILLSLTISWLLHALYLTSFGIGYLLLESAILKYNSIILAINLFMFVIIFDYMTTGTIEPIKFGIASVFSYLLINSAFSDQSVVKDTWSNGAESYILNGDYRLYTAVVGLAIGFLYLYLSLRIILNVPQALKKWAYLNFIGIFIFSQVVTFFFAFGLTTVIPGIANLLSALGGLLAIFAYYRSPQLIYVLPFDAFRLLVIDYQSSNTVYTFEWFEDEDSNVTNNLFSSALSALNSFSVEAINRGNIKEVQLDTGVMLIQPFPMNNLQFVLLASKRSEILRDNLFTFAKLFCQQFASQLSTTDEPIYEITNFDNADELISRSFPYIPPSNIQD